MASIKYAKELIEKSTNHQNNKTVVLMCSGGVDSIAATHFVLSKNRKTLHNYYVYHFNHKIRSQNDLMEKSVSQFLKDKFGKTICITGFNPIKNKSLTEAQLRDLRIQNISNLFHKCTLVTAHHLDDCVESYLMNCFRGHVEYQPIPFFTILDDSGTHNIITHPFLFTKKQQFIDYAIKHDLMKYVVEDETNKVTKGSRRNMIRNEIIPILKREKMGIDTIVEKKLKHRYFLELLK